MKEVKLTKAASFRLYNSLPYWKNSSVLSEGQFCAFELTPDADLSPYFNFLACSAGNNGAVAGDAALSLELWRFKFSVRKPVPLQFLRWWIGTSMLGTPSLFFKQPSEERATDSIANGLLLLVKALSLGLRESASASPQEWQEGWVGF